MKETALPKFYWLDAGVLNTVAGAFDEPPPASWDGVTSHVVYGGDRELADEGTRVVPAMTFVRRLHTGEIQK